MKTRVFLAGLVLLWGCGETSRRSVGTIRADGAGGDEGQGGASTDSSAGSGPLFAAGGESGDDSVAGQGGSATAGEGGAGGEAGALDQHFGLITVPAVVPESFRARAVSPKVLHAGTSVLLISRDGSRIYGTIDGQIEDPGVSTETETFAYTWSEANGTELLESDQSQACLSADGSVLFGMRPVPQQPTTFVPYRWTEATGQESLSFDFAPAVSSVFKISCSHDGNVVALQLRVAPDDDELVAVYVRGQNQDRFKAITLPNPYEAISNGLLSANGSTFMVSTETATYTGLYRARDVDQYVPPQQLSNATGIMRCWPTLLSDSGSLLLGYCFPGQPAPSRAFRFTEATGQMALLPAKMGSPQLMSSDGSLVLGADGEGAAAALLDDKPIEFSGERMTWIALEGTGKTAVAYANRSPVVGFSQAQRFTLAEGFVSLPTAPSVSTSTVLGLAVEGGVAFGYSPIDPNMERGVLWDSRGIRNVRDELQAAAVDVKGTKSLIPVQVNVRDDVRVIGTFNDPGANNLGQTFIATLPRR